MAGLFSGILREGSRKVREDLARSCCDKGKKKKKKVFGDLMVVCLVYSASDLALLVSSSSSSWIRETFRILVGRIEVLPILISSGVS